MRESYIEQQLYKKVKEKGGWAIKLLPTFIVGIPDRLILWPGGVAEFVELKAPGKTAKKSQKLIHKKLISLGFKVFVVDTTEKVKEYVDRITTS